MLNKSSKESKIHYVEVVVGIILNNDDQALMALRPAHVHCGGLWEFPGGKIEQDEGHLQALTRELKEEIGITVTAAKPFTLIEYCYDEKNVRLHVYQVVAYQGQPCSQEGQTLRWVNIIDIPRLEIPPANERITELLSKTFLDHTTG